MSASGVNVLTYRNDTASSGLNSHETQLTPANVKVGLFGKIYTTPVDGQVYTEPLVYTGVNITQGTNTVGAPGLHDVVFVGTEHDSLYAIDSSATGGAVLWKRTFLNVSNPGGNINNTLNATAIGTVANTDVNSGDIQPEIGITSTPVIDQVSNLLYVVVKTKETIGGNTHFVQRLHAINVADGTDATAPFLIGDTSSTNNTKIYVYGSGDGHVVDPGTGLNVVQFNALREHQRAALSLVNNHVYVEWASHGDNGPYHGWVVVWDVTNVKTTGFQMTGVLNTSPNNGLAGIWQGGGRLVFEPDGSAFYFETGNGSGGAPVLVSGFPSNANYNCAVVKVMADPTTTAAKQNGNGWGLKVVDFFIPYNVAHLDSADLDLGSGGPIVLPDSAGNTSHPHLMLASGKEGKIYLMDRNNLGRFNSTNDNVLNAVPNGSGNNTPPVQIGGALSTAAFFNGTIYWVSGYSNHAYAYIINSARTALTVTSQTAISFGYLPGSVMVSANGTTAGIVWVMDRNANQIHAYNANSFTTELWNSGQKSGGGDNVGSVVKFAVPTVANGKVYVGTTNSLVVYGLSSTTSPTNLTASGTPANQGKAHVSLAWTGVAGANSYNVYRSLTSNGEGGTPLATGVTATSYTDTGVAFGTKYFYKVTAVTAGVEGTMSNEASVTPLFVGHIHFTSDPTDSKDAVPGYLLDSGLAYSARSNNLSFGWNQDNTVNMRDRDSSASPDELHDGFGHMQKASNPNGWWGIALPNGTYSVHLLAGDPIFIDSVYKINVGATLSGGTFSGGVLVINGTPSSSNHWFVNTVTVTITGGVLYASNAAGSSNNKINAIDITQTA